MPELDERVRERRRRATPAEHADGQRLAEHEAADVLAAEKPSARSTPYSLVRSRTPIAMVLPRISIMISRMIDRHDVERGEDAPTRRP